MKNQHHVIIVPGLGDNVKKTKLLTNHWHHYSLHPVIYSIGWHSQEQLFQKKLIDFCSCIDHLRKNGDIVSLVGISAGGSAVLNAFIERKNEIHRVVNVCGRLRKGPKTGFRSFQKKTKSNPSFAQSLVLFEKNEHKISKLDKKRIMTVHSKFGDELVPSETTIIDGAMNIAVPMIEHELSILTTLIFLKSIIEFIKEEN